MANNENKDIAINDNSNNVPYSFVRNCFEWAESIAITIVVAIFVLAFIFRIVNVSGVSMMDTLLDKDKLIITDMFYKLKCGDVVVISHGEQYKEPIVKRVIATEGQTIDINFETGEVKVDGKKLNEPYIKTRTTKKGDGIIPKVVPKGYLFVMGDNRDRSLDSRSKEVGLIDKNNVLGKVQFIVYPLSRIGVVK